MSDNTYIQYTSSIELLKKLLGCGTFDWFEKEDEREYLIPVVSYITNRLITELGFNADIKDLVQLVFDIAEEGADKILQIPSEEGMIFTAEDLYRDVMNSDIIPEISIDEETTSTYEALEHIRKRDRFVFTWTDVTSCLTTRLKIMYASLFAEVEDQGCPCPCPKGETYKDWESYTSGVNPDDEEYINDITTSTVNGSSGGGCCCCGR